MVLCSDNGLLACVTLQSTIVNPLNTELNLICHLLALLGAHHILHVGRVRVKGKNLQFISIYAIHIVTCLTLDMSNSVNNPYQDSKNTQCINKIQYNITDCCNISIT